MMNTFKSHTDHLGEGCSACSWPFSSPSRHVDWKICVSSKDIYLKKDFATVIK